MSPDKDRYNKLRGNLGIDKLDKDDKKKLIGEFAKVGGKVDFSVFDREERYRGMLTGKPDELSDDEKQQREREKKIRDQNRKHREERERREDSAERRKRYAAAEAAKKQEAPKKTDFGAIDRKMSLKKDLLSATQKKGKTEESRAALEAENEQTMSGDGIRQSRGLRLPMSLLDRIMFIINGLLMRITGFNIDRFHSSFLLDFLPQYTAVVSRMGYFLRSCINSPPVKKGLRTTLVKLSPNHYDIIFQYLNLFDEPFLNELYEKSLTQYSSRFPQDEFNKFAFHFKKLYLIRQNSAIFEVAALTARNIYSQYYKLSLKEVDLLNDIMFITTVGYEKLHFVYCLNLGKYISSTGFGIADYLDFNSSDMLGFYYTKEKLQEDETIRKLNEFNAGKKDIIEEDIEQKELAKIPDDVKKGFAMMDDVWNAFIAVKETQYANDPIVSKLPVEDKILTVFVLYKEFMDQYTIYLMLKEVEYNLGIEEHVKVDVKDELNNVMNELNILFKDYEKYAEIVQKLKFTEDESFFIDRRTVSLKDQRATLSFEIRKKLTDILYDMMSIIKLVIRDYQEKARKVIGNPDERLTIDTNLHGQKKYNNQSIIFIFSKCYYFVNAWLWRLEKTDLSGPQVLIS